MPRKIVSSSEIEGDVDENGVISRHPVKALRKPTNFTADPMSGTPKTVPRLVTYTSWSMASNILIHPPVRPPL